MKKLSFIFICATLIACLLLPNLAFADSQQAKDIHFISPVGIALVGNNLFVKLYSVIAKDYIDILRKSYK